MDTNYASLETASSMPPMNNTTNGHSHSYVDTEVSSNKMNMYWLYPCIGCIRNYFRMFSLGFRKHHKFVIPLHSDLIVNRNPFVTMTELFHYVKVLENP